MVKYQPPVPLLITLYHSFRRGLAYQKGNKGRKPASTHSPLAWAMLNYRHGKPLNLCLNY